MPRAFRFGQQRNERFLQSPRPGRALEFSGAAGGEHIARVNCHKPVETLGLLHVGCGYDNAHAGAPCPDAIDQFPKLPPRERIHAGRRFIENEQIGIVNERARQPQLLLHAAGKFSRRPTCERLETSAYQQFLDPPRAFLLRLTKQPAEEIDVLENGKRWVKILSQTLRHVGDARTNRRPMT